MADAPPREDAAGGAQAAAGDPLAALRARGADRLAPVHFRFVEALARRAQAQRGDARRLLDARLARAIDDYAGRFAQAQDEACQALATAAAKHPEAADDLRRLADAGDFAALRRRIAALDRPPAALAGLSALSAGAGHGNRRASPATAAPVASDAGAPHPAPADELKSLHYFRDTWSRLSVDRQLAEALAQAPENAGPLNSQRLVLRALECLRELSPDYLNRFMVHADALLWLDQASGGAVPMERGGPPADGDGKRKPASAGARKGGGERSARR